MKVQGLQFRVYSLGFKVQGLGFKFKVWSLGLKVEEVEGLEFVVYSLGVGTRFRVEGCVFIEFRWHTCSTGLSENTLKKVLQEPKTKRLRRDAALLLSRLPWLSRCHKCQTPWSAQVIYEYHTQARVPHRNTSQFLAAGPPGPLKEGA